MASVADTTNEHHKNRQRCFRRPWILVGGTTIKVAGPWNDVNRPKCNAQYESDMFQCSFARAARSRAACEDQAMTRFVSCMKVNPVPPHIYYLGDSR